MHSMKLALAIVAAASFLVSCGYSPPPSSYSSYAPRRPAGPSSAPAWCAELRNSGAKPIAVSDLYNRVRGLVKPKGEFETTSAFDARAAEALAVVKPHLERVSGTDHVVVVLPLYAPYSADKGVFTVSTGYGGITGSHFVMGDDYKTYDFEFIVAATGERNVGGYVGSNAFGVTRQVRSVAREEFGVALVDQKWSTEGSWTSSRGGLTVSVSPDRAAATKGKVGLMVIGDLAAPGVIEGSRHYAATIDDPVEVKVRQHYIAMTAPCAAIVAMDNNEVLHKLN